MKLLFKTTILSLCIFCCSSQSVQALSLSVTPTLVDMAAVPGQAWSTNVKVINNNDTPLTVYAETRNFAPRGEFGAGAFLPVYEEMTGGTTLAEWMSVSPMPVIIPPEGTAVVPVQVNVPIDANPGGHYAAVMIGTKAPSDDEGFKVQTSQVISALFFLRVAGDVDENGTIRSFVSGGNMVFQPTMDFTLRFENKGNVHLRPQGEIIITNMWGKERGVIPVNQKTHFGNVLPESIREYSFAWTAEDSFVDIGRYKAMVTLGYGGESKQFATRHDYFWIIPLKPLLMMFAALATIIFVTTFFVRMYIRRMLSLSGVGTSNTYVPQHQRAQAGDVQVLKQEKMIAPVQAGWSDFSKRFEHWSTARDFVATWISFVKDYRWFFGAVVFTLLVIGVVWQFFTVVYTDETNYEVTVDSAGAATTISSDEIYAERNGVTDTVPEVAQSYRLEVINDGGAPGIAAATAGLLRDNGYRISDITTELNASRARTVVVYEESLQAEALAISALLGDVLISANAEATDPVITIYIGSDASVE